MSRNTEVENDRNVKSNKFDNFANINFKNIEPISTFSNNINDNSFIFNNMKSNDNILESFSDFNRPSTAPININKRKFNLDLKNVLNSDGNKS